jgi:hypothetical protein
MHLYSFDQNREVAQNDDGSVPSGYPYASRITQYLKPGYYGIFIHAYCSNQYDLSHFGRCNLYYNGNDVVDNFKFGGQMISAYTNKGDRVSTTNLSGNGGNEDTYMLLLAANGEMVGFDDDGNGYPKSAIIDALDKRQSEYGPSYYVIGAFWEEFECLCDLQITHNSNYEFASFYGSDDFQQECANAFGNTFTNSSNHNTASSNGTFASSAPFFENNRLSQADGKGIDMFDLIFINCHGNVGEISMNNHDQVYLTQSNHNLGSGDRIEGLSGDLEYLCLLSCMTVRLQHTQSFDWLGPAGWASYTDASGNFHKGVFDGLHVVVGFHSLHNFWYVGWPISEDNYSSWGNRLANKIKGNTSIWNSWQETCQEESAEYPYWWWNDYTPGNACAIAINGMLGESLANRQNRDIRYGDSRYLFQIATFCTNSEDMPPN